MKPHCNETTTQHFNLHHYPNVPTVPQRMEKEHITAPQNCSLLMDLSHSFYYHMPEAQAPHHSIIFSSSLPTACLSHPPPQFSIQVTSTYIYTSYLSTVPFVLLHESHCHQIFPSKTSNFSLSYLLRTGELLKASFRPLYLLSQAGKQDSFLSVGVMFKHLTGQVSLGSIQTFRFVNIISCSDVQMALACLVNLQPSPEEPQMKWAAQMANTGEGSFGAWQRGDQTKQRQ